MAKVLTGKVVSTKMQQTVVVSVTHLKPHPLYKKLLRRSKNYNVDPNGQTVAVGQEVKIEEAKKMGKNKCFKILEVIVKSHERAEKQAKGGKKA